MTVFLTPDGEPFFGGTYFPPEPRHGLPSFREVLAAVAEAYRERRGDVEAPAAQLVEPVRARARARPSPEPLPTRSSTRPPATCAPFRPRAAASAARRSSRPRRRSSSCSAGGDERERPRTLDAMAGGM